MKIWKYLMVGAMAGAACIVGTARAQDQTTTTVVQTEPPPPVAVYTNYDTDVNDFYRDHEFSIDAFASGSLGEEIIDHISGDRIKRNGRLGAGAGLNIFFSRYVGIGGDAYSEDTSGRFVDYASGNLILRFPIINTGIAPYIFGGGGYQFDRVTQRLAQGGGGIEFRFAQHVGFFVDARYVFADKTDHYGVGRAGLRFNF
jgi:hypothetical protein